MKKNRKRKKKRRRKPRCGPDPLGFTAHPAPPRQPACQPRPPSPSARAAQLAAQHTSPTPARLSAFSLLPLPLGPACQPPPSTVSSSSPTPLTPPTKPRQRWQERARGVTPRARPCLLGAAPTQPLAIVGCKHAPPIALEPHPPITGLRRSPIGYKAPALVP